MDQKVLLAVNGTLMRGLELNPNLIATGASFIQQTCTASAYRLWSIGDAYPAMQRDDQLGTAITVEVWEISPDGLLEILANEPPGLCLGRIELKDASTVFGILGETWICGGQNEITACGGWREYLSLGSQ